MSDCHGDYYVSSILRRVVAVSLRKMHSLFILGVKCHFCLFSLRRASAQKHVPLFRWLYIVLRSRRINPRSSSRDILQGFGRIDCIREYLQESYKNGVILQVQKNLASFLKETCQETSDHLTDISCKKINKSVSSKIMYFLNFLPDFCIFLEK